MKNTILALAGILLITACGNEASITSAPSAEEKESSAESRTMSGLLAGPHRSPEEAARDVFRHPEETLAFFGLQRDMTVYKCDCTLPSNGQRHLLRGKF